VWGFFIAVQKRVFIPLPYVTAVRFKPHEPLVTVIFTVISVPPCKSLSVKPKPRLNLFSLFYWSVLQSFVPRLYEEAMLSKRMWSTIWIVVIVIAGTQGSGCELPFDLTT
jgi:hypothetical protein